MQCYVYIRDSKAQLERTWKSWVRVIGDSSEYVIIEMQMVQIHEGYFPSLSALSVFLFLFVLGVCTIAFLYLLPYKYDVGAAFPTVRSIFYLYRRLADPRRIFPVPVGPVRVFVLVRAWRLYDRF
ncbi:unnamed protein product [Toxocara canis]|uniref:Transmembrane protein n=1 Tax=Toxocara canis TaxID=6265 RepID=A0A183U413_TOXCA|nr:unnamed protein product [Toxocara canis]